MKRLFIIAAAFYIAWRIVRVVLVMLLFSGALAAWYPDWALPDSVRVKNAEAVVAMVNASRGTVKQSST